MPGPVRGTKQDGADADGKSGDGLGKTGNSDKTDGGLGAAPARGPDASSPAWELLLSMSSQAPASPLSVGLPWQP